MFIKLKSSLNLNKRAAASNKKIMPLMIPYKLRLYLYAGTKSTYIDVMNSFGSKFIRSITLMILMEGTIIIVSVMIIPNIITLNMRARYCVKNSMSVCSSIIFSLILSSVS